MTVLKPLIYFRSVKNSLNLFRDLKIFFEFIKKVNALNPSRKWLVLV